VLTIDPDLINTRFVGGSSVGGVNYDFSFSFIV
jgi:hypothetical protein